MRLPSHQQRRGSENYISRKLVLWFAFVSSLVIRTDKLAILVSEPLSRYVNDDDCYINISLFLLSVLLPVIINCECHWFKVLIDCVINLGKFFLTY